jgi:NitT/TauT family transport system substrate-binding protein
MSIGKHLVGLAAAALVSAGVSQAANAEPLRIFYFNWAGFGPLFVAQEKGLFAKEGIEVELINVEETHAAYAGLSHGQVDVVAGAFQDTAFFSTPDDVLLCVLVTEDSRGADGIVANKDIRSVADLKGKMVAFEAGSVTHFYISVLLEQAGLSDADIEQVDLVDADTATAFLLREVDAAVTWGAMLIEALQAPHGHLLTNSSEQPGLLVGCLITTARVLADRQADFRALGRAWDAAVDYIEAHRDEAVAIMAGHMRDKGPIALSETLSKIQLYDGERNRHYFGSADNPGQIHQTAQYAIELWSRLGVLDFELSPGDVVSHDLWVE